MRQTLYPRTAGALHGSPVRFDLAEHRGARCTGLSVMFFTPPLSACHIADDGLAAVVDVDVLDRHFLRPRASWLAAIRAPPSSSSLEPLRPGLSPSKGRYLPRMTALPGAP